MKLQFIVFYFIFFEFFRRRFFLPNLAQRTVQLKNWKVKGVQTSYNLLFYNTCILKNLGKLVNNL